MSMSKFAPWAIAGATAFFAGQIAQNLTGQTAGGWGWAVGAAGGVVGASAALWVMK